MAEWSNVVVLRAIFRGFESHHVHFVLFIFVITRVTEWSNVVVSRAIFRGFESHHVYFVLLYVQFPRGPMELRFVAFIHATRVRFPAREHYTCGRVVQCGSLKSYFSWVRTPPCV